MAEHPRPPVELSLPPDEGRRRFSPRIWHHDWHHLRELRRGLEGKISNLLKDLPNDATIVDYGAGDTPYRDLFTNHPERNYLSCDLDPDAEIPLASGGRLPLDDQSADAVVSFQVLEHVPDCDLYLGECRRVLRPRGRLLLSTHGTWLYHPHPTDFRRWTRDGLLLEVERSGFEVESIVGLVGPLAWTTQFRLFGYREVLLKIPFVGVVLVPLLCAVMNLRMVLEEWLTPNSIRQDNACVYVLSARRV